jgi:hypothetical protein
MSYNTIAACAADTAFFNRVTACAAQEGENQNPGYWTTQHIWEIASDSEIEASYEYAVNSDNPNPGGDDNAITDTQIKGKVQGLMGTTPTP